MENNIQYLKEEAKIYERGILSLLLEVSKSFSDESFTKEKRDEIFVKIDGLRDKVKDINKVISDLQKREEDIKEGSVINKKENNIDNLVELKEKNEETNVLDNSVEKEKCAEIIEENIDADLNDVIDNKKEMLTVKKEEIIDIEVVESDSDDEDIELENENIRRRNRGRRSRRNVVYLDQNENNNVEKISEEVVGENNNDSNYTKNTDNDDLTQDMEEIDRLIEEAQNLNNNIIKFPKNRRKGIENNENVDLDILGEKEDKYEESKLDDVIEPVPVLFGNSRAQNQMVIRKKSNGFSDKLKSLIFKIRTMLGGENEE